jgi:predicted nuclease with TOPRIM domain
LVEKLKKEFLKLLERDLEFRYTVAGYLGLSEILKRLDRLEEGQKRLWEEVKGLREGQNKLWEEVRSLREDQRKLRVSFESFGRALGVTLEDYSASFVKLMLEDMGYPDAQVGRKTMLFNGEIYEINIFCEEPLTVGEVTLYIGDLDEARRELEKLQKRIEIAEKTTGKKAALKILAIANTPKEILDHLKTTTKQQNIKLIYGRELVT